MIITATPGRTLAKVVLDADHPLIYSLARTNLAPNPSYEYGTVSPAVASGQATIATAVVNGNTRMRITPTGAGTNTSAYPIGAASGTFAVLGCKPGDTLTVSGYLVLTAAHTGNFDANARKITVGYLRGDGSNTYTETTSAQAANVAGQTRLSVTFTVPSDATGINLRLMNGSDTPADLVYWDGLLIESGAVLGAYFSGDTTNTTRETYAWSGTAGSSRSTVTVAHSPLEAGVPTPVAVRYGTGNFHGPYSTSDSDRMAQIPAGVSLITSGVWDLFGASELHEENDMHWLFLGRVKQVDTDWDLAEGDGGNQLLFRPSIYAVSRVVNLQMPGSRSMSDFTVRHVVTGFEFHVLVVHTRADDTDGKSRESERQAQFRFVAQYAASIRYVIVSGDWNFKSSTITASRAVLATAGIVGLQTREPGLPNGDKDSYSGGSGGRWIDDIFTRVAQSVGGSAGVVVGAASDHYLWVRTTVTFVVNAPAAAVKVSLFRRADGAEVPVPGVQNINARTMVVTDHTAPLGRDVVYVARLNDGTAYETPPLQLLAAVPQLTHPVTGRSSDCVIQTWPERTRQTASTKVVVPGRRSPVVLADVEGLGATSPVLLTKTQAEWDDVDDLAATGDTLLLRTIYPELPDAFLSIETRSIGRVSDFRGRSTARLHTLSSQEIGVEDMTELGLGDTLGDLAGALPGGALGDLAALFPGGTLLDIAVADWRSGVAPPVTPDDPNPNTPDALYPSDVLYPSDSLYPGA